MTETQRNRRLKSSAERLEELSGELNMLDSDLQNFERSGALQWISSIGGRLHKLLVDRGSSNIPLLIDLARQEGYSIDVYISNIVIADLRAEKAGRERPMASVIPNILSVAHDPWYSTKMPLDHAIKMRCLILGGQEYSFRDILINVRDTEGQHSDRGRPLSLDQLDNLEFPYGMTGSHMPIYHLAQVVRSLGKRFVKQVGEAE